MNKTGSPEALKMVTSPRMSPMFSGTSTEAETLGTSLEVSELGVLKLFVKSEETEAEERRGESEVFTVGNDEGWIWWWVERRWRLWLAGADNPDPAVTENNPIYPFSPPLCLSSWDGSWTNGARECWKCFITALTAIHKPHNQFKGTTSCILLWINILK